AHTSCSRAACRRPARCGSWSSTTGCRRSTSVRPSPPGCGRGWRRRDATGTGSAYRAPPGTPGQPPAVPGDGPPVHADDGPAAAPEAGAARQPLPRAGRARGGGGDDGEDRGGREGREGEGGRGGLGGEPPQGLRGREAAGVV